MLKNSVAVHVVNSRTGKRQFVGETTFGDEGALWLGEKLYPFSAQNYNPHKAKAVRDADSRRALRNQRRSTLLDIIYTMRLDAWVEGGSFKK